MNSRGREVSDDEEEDPQPTFPMNQTTGLPIPDQRAFNRRRRRQAAGDDDGYDTDPEIQGVGDADRYEYGERDVLHRREEGREPSMREQHEEARRQRRRTGEVADMGTPFALFPNVAPAPVQDVAPAFAMDALAANLPAAVSDEEGAATDEESVDGAGRKKKVYKSKKQKFEEEEAERDDIHEEAIRQAIEARNQDLTGDLRRHKGLFKTKEEHWEDYLKRQQAEQEAQRFERGRQQLEDFARMGAMARRVREQFQQDPRINLTEAEEQGLMEGAGRSYIVPHSFGFSKMYM